MPAAVDGNEFTISLRPFEPQRALRVPIVAEVVSGEAAAAVVRRCRDGGMYKHSFNNINDFCTRMYAHHFVTNLVAIY